MFEIFFLASLLFIGFSQLLPEDKRPSQPQRRSAATNSAHSSGQRKRRDQMFAGAPRVNLPYHPSHRIPFRAHAHRRRRQNNRFSTL